jgi:hypothetical protein
MRRAIRTALPGFVLLASCSATEPSPSLPAGAQLVGAPAHYLEWFHRTEACAGLSGSFEAIEWYVVPGVTAFSTEDGEKVGLWSRQGTTHRIVIAGDYRDHEMVVRHEMLHSIIGRSGHPAEYFGARCGLTWETWTGD